MYMIEEVYIDIFDLPLVSQSKGGAASSRSYEQIPRKWNTASVSQGGGWRWSFRAGCRGEKSCPDRQRALKTNVDVFWNWS